MANTIIVAGLAITPARRLLLADIAAHKVADDDEGTPMLDLGADGTRRVAEGVWALYQAGLCWQPDDTHGWRLTEIGSDIHEGRVFHGVRCARCKAGLHDRDGNPRWEVVGKLDFVCMGGCKTVRR